MADDVDLPTCQVLAVLPTADKIANPHPVEMWKLLRRYLLANNSQGTSAAEGIQDALKTGVPYLIPFCFSRSVAETMAGELQRLGYKARVVDQGARAAS